MQIKSPSQIIAALLSRSDITAAEIIDALEANGWRFVYNHR
jgi:hypothetical protein